MLFKTVFVALCVIAGTVALESPVFLWNVPTDAKPSLATVTQNEFSALLTPFLKTHTIVAFLEDDLSSRDLTCQSADSKQSCFAHLSSVAPKAYYASVESPVDALRQIASVKEYNSIDAEGKFSLPVELSAGKVILVNFDKSNNQRGAILEQHDAAIKAVSDKLTGNVVFLYLSSSNGNNQQVKRMRRSTAAPLGGYIFREGAQFLIYFSQVNYTNNAGTKSIEVINTMTVTGDNTTLSVSMAAASGKTLEYLVIYEKGYYNIRNVTFDNVQFRNKDLAAPVTFSYHCGNITLNAMSSLTAPNNAKLTFGNLQFQAPFGSSSQANFTFGNNWDCVPFFTPGILSGLFVTIFLLVITFVGICWMVDINTMDRFEDPKGKTITVNQAAE